MKRLKAVMVAATAWAVIATAAIGAPGDCDRACLRGTVDQLLASMVAHKPEALPLADVYIATENTHPAALGMMTAWTGITQAGKPSLLALDPALGSAYFALVVRESGSPAVLWGRIKVADRKISEVEIFENRSRGDHGFSYSPEQLPTNYRKLMDVPAARKRASHEELVRLARASFDADDPLPVAIANDCQFTELGWKVIDPGLDDVKAAPPPGAKPGEVHDPNAPLGCVFPPYRPTDKKARIIAIDDELGFVVVAGVVPGHAYPYPHFGHMVSAFIPDQMREPAVAQDAWFARHVAKHAAPVVRPEPATSETMQVLQYYDGKLQASQINVYLTGPGTRPIWLQPCNCRFFPTKADPTVVPAIQQVDTTLPAH